MGRRVWVSAVSQEGSGHSMGAAGHGKITGLWSMRAIFHMFSSNSNPLYQIRFSVLKQNRVSYIPLSKNRAPNVLEEHSTFSFLSQIFPVLPMALKRCFPVTQWLLVQDLLQAAHHDG